MPADFAIENHGTICLLRPFTEAAGEWVSEHINREESQFWGSAVVVEPRYLDAILEGIQNDGLVIA